MIAKAEVTDKGPNPRYVVTDLEAEAQVGTIRLKLLKIGTVIVRNTRRIRLFFSSAYPYKELFSLASHRLGTG